MEPNMVYFEDSKFRARRLVDGKWVAEMWVQGFFGLFSGWYAISRVDNLYKSGTKYFARYCPVDTYEEAIERLSRMGAST